MSSGVDPVLAAAGPAEVARGSCRASRLGRDSSPVLAPSAAFCTATESAEVGKESEPNELPLPCFWEKQGGGGYTSVVWIFNPLNLAVLLWSMVVTIGIMDLDDGYSYFTKG